MKLLHLLLASITILATCSCSSAGATVVPPPGIAEASKPKSLKNILPTSFLGKQSFASFEQEVRHGDFYSKTTIRDYNTQNPDPDLTKAAKAVATTNILAGVTKHGLTETGRTTRHIDDNAVRIRANDNAAATEQLRIKNPPPVE